LTRLALSAGALSAAGVVGTALPAAAAPGHPATHFTTSSVTTASTTTPAAATPKARSAKATTTKAKSAKATTAKAQPAKARTAKAGPAKARPAATTPKAKTSKATSTSTATRHARVTGGRTSANWSGYTQSAADLRRPVDAVSGSWRVTPARQHVRGRAEAVSDWVGVGGGRVRGKSDPTLVQAGSATTVSRGGYASYYTWYETLPTEAVVTPLAAHPGDRLTVSIRRTGAEWWRIRLANGTTGHHWSTSVRYVSGRSSADWITERPDIAGVPSSLPTRAATTYRHATVNGHSVRFSPAQRVTMTDGSRAVATPSGPESNGSGVSVCSYRSSC
jgi:hypothetical protein